MTARLGAMVIDVLEQAGERYLKNAAPDAYATFLLQVGGADTLRIYDSSATYWERVQRMLDSFFTSAERAQIAARLIARVGGHRPELRSFLNHARAERQVRDLIAAAHVAGAATWRPQVAAMRRVR